MVLFIFSPQTESHYSTRSATRAGAQVLESPVNIKTGNVPKTKKYEMGGPIGKSCTQFAMLGMDRFQTVKYNLDS